ncbi:MAG: hypothetical protein AAF589_00545, partial [Planctomycetota bacterium]
MFPRFSSGPFTVAASLAALITCGFSSGSASAQPLQWQRGGVQPASAVSTDPSTRQGASAGHRFMTPGVARQAAFSEPLEDAAPVKQPTAAKRPTRRASPAKAVAPADYRELTESKPAVETTVDGDIYFASEVRQAATRTVAETESMAAPAGFVIGIGGDGCGAYVEPGCGIPEPGCAVVDPGCAIPAPACGCPEPGCGCAMEVCEPGVCGDCICGDVGCCGSCVGAPCPPPSLGGCAERGAVPICIYLPPIKEVVLFGGVQG